MKLRTRTVAVAAALSAVALFGSGTPARAAGAGAAVIPCENVFPELGGVLIFATNGTFMGNCWEHFIDGGRPVEVTKTDVNNCLERFEDSFPEEWLVGIQVITASGQTLTNCLVHFPRSK
jgi:hypothetical protein